MSLIVTLRPTDSIDLHTTHTGTLEALYEDIRAQVPDGYELTSVTASNGTAIARRIGRDEVTIADRSELAACVPDGWQAVSVRQA